MTRDNAVVFLGAWIDACALWRLYMPYLNMPGSGFYVFAQKPDFTAITGADVAVVQRCCTPPQYQFIKLVSQLGMKVVYDLDDNVWELPEYNPAAKVLEQHREGFRHCIQLVDVVSVSTKTLAKDVRRHVKHMVNLNTGKEIPIIVAENRMDRRMFAPPAVPKKIVGWAGSTSHVGDLQMIVPAVSQLAQECPDWTFQFRGCEAPSELFSNPNVEQKVWSPVAEYGARMPRWAWAIALAPLQQNRFNDCKSAIKMIEAAYCKIPCLASWCRPYEEFCYHDRELKWLLVASQGAWLSKLRELINDDARRIELGERMHQVMLKHYSFDRDHEGWRNVFDTARAL